MQPTTPDGHLLTVEEVAQRLRLSKMTVYRLLHNHEIEHIRVGRSFRVPAEELKRYLKDQTQERHA